MPVSHILRAEQIGGQRTVPRLIGLAVDVVIAEQPHFLRLGIAVRQADDDDMDVRLATRVGSPGEGAMRERDLQPIAIEPDRPGLRDLQERKSVGEGRSVSDREEYGGRTILKKKKEENS